MAKPNHYRNHSMDTPIENQFPVDIYAPLLDRIPVGHIYGHAKAKKEGK